MNSQPTPRSFFANLLSIHYLFRKLICNSLSVSWIHVPFTIFFANSLFIYYPYHESTFNSLSLSRIYLKFPISFANSLWIHYRFRESTLDSLFFRVLTFNSLRKVTIRKTMINLVVHLIEFAHIGPLIMVLILMNVLKLCLTARLNSHLKTTDEFAVKNHLVRKTMVDLVVHHIEFAYILPLKTGLI